MGKEIFYGPFCALTLLPLANSAQSFVEISAQVLDQRLNITTRRKFKCKGCHHQFSVTSGTMFHSPKLDFVDLLDGICLFVTGSKGMSAVQFSRTMDVQYKTAWVWCHKMREALADETDHAKLSGEVEIDGCYVGGHVRKANFKTDRKDRRLNANRCCCSA